MRFERRIRMVQQEFRRAAATLGQGEPQTAAGINTIKTETVHKSIFALMGQAVPVSAFATLTAGISVQKSRSQPFARVLYSSFGRWRIVKVLSDLCRAIRYGKTFCARVLLQSRAVEPNGNTINCAIGTTPGGLQPSPPPLGSRSAASDAVRSHSGGLEEVFRREHVQRNARDPQPSRFFQDSHLHPDSQPHRGPAPQLRALPADGQAPPGARGQWPPVRLHLGLPHHRLPQRLRARVRRLLHRQLGVQVRLPQGSQPPAHRLLALRPHGHHRPLPPGRRALQLLRNLQQEHP